MTHLIAERQIGLFNVVRFEGQHHKENELEMANFVSEYSGHSLLFRVNKQFSFLSYVDQSKARTRST